MRRSYTRTPFRGRAIIALAAMIAALGIDTGLAEPAHADVSFAKADFAARGARAIGGFRFAGQEIALTAVGRSGYADTVLARDHILESRAMGKVYPGHPQPAYVTFDLRVAF